MLNDRVISNLDRYMLAIQVLGYTFVNFNTHCVNEEENCAWNIQSGIIWPLFLTADYWITSRFQGLFTVQKDLNKTIVGRILFFLTICHVFFSASYSPFPSAYALDIF